MYSGYLGYLDTQNHLNMDEMHKIHNDILKSIIDEDSKELYEDLVKQCTKYAEYRINWLLYNREEKINKDSYRSSCHDTLIIKFDILSRYIKSLGISTDWREELGDVKLNPLNRKKIGDFACYIAFINGLNAR